jgi:hypothetical protein
MPKGEAGGSQNAEKSSVRQRVPALKIFDRFPQNIQNMRVGIGYFILIATKY